MIAVETFTPLLSSIISGKCSLPIFPEMGIQCQTLGCATCVGAQGTIATIPKSVQEAGHSELSMSLRELPREEGLGLNVIGRRIFYFLLLLFLYIN